MDVLALVGLCLSSASLAALLPYNWTEPLFFFSSSDPLEFFIDIGPFSVLVVILAGTAAVSCSAALRAALEAMLGSSLGCSSWLLLVILLHLRVLSVVELAPRFVGIGSSLLERFPLDLGSQVLLIIQILNSDGGGSQRYMFELCIDLLLRLLPMYLLTFLALLLQFFSTRLRLPARDTIIIGMAGIITPLFSTYAAKLGQTVSQSASQGGLTTWEATLLLGINASWLACWMCRWSDASARSLLGGLWSWVILTVLLPLSWLALSARYIAESSIGRQEALWSVLSAACILGAGLAMIELVNHILRNWSGTATLVLKLALLIVMLLPLSADGRLSAALFQALPHFDSPLSGAPESLMLLVTILGSTLLSLVTIYGASRRRLGHSAET